MILHIYNCNLAIVSDKRYSKARSNIPEHIKHFPEKEGMVGAEFLPPTDGFKVKAYTEMNGKKLERDFSQDISTLLSLFRKLDPLYDPDCPVSIRWDVLTKKLGLDRNEVEKLLDQVYRMKIVGDDQEHDQRSLLTLNYNHWKWMKHSRIKGCLVVMICIEKSDVRYSSLINDFVHTIINIQKAITKPPEKIKEQGLSSPYVLNDIILIPNVHFTDQVKTSHDSDFNIRTFTAMKDALDKKGFRTILSSYGYAKNFLFAINAHHVGYMWRKLPISHKHQ